MREDAAEVEAVQAEVDGYLLLTPRPETARAAISRLRGGSAGSSLAESTVFRTVRKGASDAEVHLLVQPVPLMVMLNEAVTASLQTQENPAAGLLDPAGLMRALGLDALQALSISVGFKPAGTRMFMSLQLNAPRGVFSLYRKIRPGPVKLEPFVPADVASAGAANVHVKDLLDAVREIVREASPPLHGMLELQIKQWSQGLGMDIEQTLRDGLSPRLWTAEFFKTDEAEAVAHDAAMTETVYVFHLEDPESVGNLLGAIQQTLLSSLPNVESRKYLEAPVWEIRLAQGESAPSSLAYAVAGEWLLVSIGSARPLERLLDRLHEPDPASSLWARPDVARALSELPPEAGQVSYMDFSRVVHRLVRFVLALGSQEECGDAPCGDAPEGLAGYLDLQRIPSLPTLRRYLGVSVGAGWSDGLSFFSVTDIRTPEP